MALDAKADCYPAFEAAEAFVVNILSAGQKDVAIRFATRGIDKFAGLSSSPGEHTGGPVIDGIAAHLECLMHERHVAGDHLLLVGRVVEGSGRTWSPSSTTGGAFGRFEPAVLAGLMDAPACLGEALAAPHTEHTPST